MTSHLFGRNPKFLSVIAGAVLALAAPAAAQDRPDAVLYKDPQCGCCEAYADYLRRNGFRVTVTPTLELDRIKRRYAVPEGFEGCHTTVIDGYVVEGHVPLGILHKLLGERPNVTGLSLPGMPEGSPGMTGRKSAPFTIYRFGGGRPEVYAVE